MEEEDEPVNQTKSTEGDDIPDDIDRDQPKKKKHDSDSPETNSTKQSEFVDNDTPGIGAELTDKGMNLDDDGKDNNEAGLTEVNEG
eukprot:scaffold177191_cov76-Cyclotella_meneghiniana.AAC.1